MSAIWKAFLLAHRLQHSQIAGAVCNPPCNTNDTFHSMIPLVVSTCHTSPRPTVCVGHQGRSHVPQASPHSASMLGYKQASPQGGHVGVCCSKGNSAAPCHLLGRDVCFGRSTVVTEIQVSKSPGS